MATPQTQTPPAATVAAEPQAPQVPAVIERGAVPARPAKSALEVFGLQPTTIREWLDYCGILVRSGLVNDQKPEQTFVRIAKGVEMGLTPLAAAQWVYPVPGEGGKISLGVMAEGKVAAVLASGACKYFTIIESTDKVCTVETWRHGRPEAQRQTFTLEQAKTAGLLNKKNWQQYPTDQLYAKAAGRLCSRVYADVLSARGVDAVAEIDDDVPVAYVRRQHEAPLDPTAQPAAAAPAAADPEDVSLGSLFGRWKEVYPETERPETKEAQEAVRQDRIRRMGELIGRAIGSWNDLTAAERREAYDRLGALLAERREAHAAEVPFDRDEGAGREPGDDGDLFGAPRRTGP